MSIFTSANRVVANTSKQIRRSGWLAIGSTVVMALAFFIGTIFIFLAFASNLYLQSIENKPHIYVFFNSGTDNSVIFGLEDKLQQMPEIYSVEYTDEQSAFEEYKTVKQTEDPEFAKNIREDVLPPSLGIRLNKINDADKIIDYVIQEKEKTSDIYALGYSKESIDMFKNLFNWLRIAGGALIAVLIIVIFLFTLLTVEFRTYNREEEISIMQLVGGSLWFIRAPFILEGAFYGLVGAFISNIVIYSLSYWIFIVNKTSAEVMFILKFVSDLSWPTLSIYHYAGIFVLICIAGIILGAINSLIAIKRYIF